MSHVVSFSLKFVVCLSFFHPESAVQRVLPCQAWAGWGRHYGKCQRWSEGEAKAAHGAECPMRVSPRLGRGGGGGGEGEEGIKSSHCAAGRWGLRLAGRAVWGPEPGQEGRGWAGRSPLWPFQREAPGGVWGTGRDSPGMSQHGNASHPSVYKASPVCKLPEPH